MQVQTLSLAAKRKLESAARACGKIDGLIAERDSLRKQVGDLRAQLAASAKNAEKLSSALKDSNKAKEASESAVALMSKRFNEEADEVKRLKAKVDEDADELKKLKAKISDLEHSAGTRNYGFAAFALDAVNNYREASSTVGAETNPLVEDPSIGEFEFFRCFTEELKVLQSLLTSSADYGAALGTEVAFNVLEGQGWPHYFALSDGRISIDNKARAGY